MINDDANEEDYESDDSVRIARRKLGKEALT